MAGTAEQREGNCKKKTGENKQKLHRCTKKAGWENGDGKLERRAEQDREMKHVDVHERNETR